MIRRILIVNDSHMERKMAHAPLGDQYFVEEAETGDEALAKMDDMEYDIILLDNVMKNETGYELAREIREDHRYDHIPLILLSSNENPVDEMEAFESGFNAYLHKSDVKERILPLIQSFEQQELSSPKQVLVVDDSRTIRTLLTFTFKQAGFTVKAAESGEEALSILETFLPNFITMDVEMDGMDGFETSHQIRQNEQTKDIPIVMISSQESIEARINALECGVAEYFVKPFDPKELMRYVKNVLLRLERKPSHTIAMIGKSLTEEQHIISYALNQRGCATLAITDPEKIWTVLDHQTIELILLDLDQADTPPSYNLLQRLTKEIARLNRQIPIIVVAGIQNKHGIIEAFRKGATDYISKPFETQEVALRVLTHLNQLERMD